MLPLIGQHWLSWLFGYTRESTVVTVEAPGWCLYPCIPHTDFNCLIQIVLVFSSICSSITLFSSNSIIYTSCFPFLIYNPLSLFLLLSLASLTIPPRPVFYSISLISFPSFPPFLPLSSFLSPSPTPFPPT